MSNVKVVLSKRQIAYVCEITEIDDPNQAIKKLGELIIQEGLSASDIGMVVDKLMQRAKK